MPHIYQYRRFESIVSDPDGSVMLRQESYRSRDLSISINLFFVVSHFYDDDDRYKFPEDIIGDCRSLFVLKIDLTTH